MHFIEHIVEPKRLLLAWQSFTEEERTRYIVAELKRIGEEITLTYLTETNDFIKAKAVGFDAYPAFKDTGKVYHNVEDAFMRRLPPRSREDFSQYLEGFRLHEDVKLSDFALLGYSGAKLMSDGFSLIHPFESISDSFELLVEVAGFRHYVESLGDKLAVEDEVSFEQSYHKYDDIIKEESVCIKWNHQVIGYVNRGLKDRFIDWLTNHRIDSAFIEKLNGTTQRPALYIFLRVKK